MSADRFTHVDSFHRGSFRIAQMRDTLTGRDFFVYKGRDKWFEWDGRYGCPLRDIYGLVSAAERALKKRVSRVCPTPSERVREVWDLRDRGYTAEQASRAAREGQLALEGLEVGA